jgi:hypothetical protein
LAFWINWLLTLVNGLLPAFPLDGSRWLRALLWPKHGYRTAVQLVVRAAKVTALLLFVLAWLLRDTGQDPNPTVSPTLPLALFAVFLFFSARHESERLLDSDTGETGFGYDFSQGYTSLEKFHQPPRAREPGPLKRWLEARRASRMLRQQEIEDEEERRVDEVLARLHEHGRDGITADDRALLDRVSARYRNRQRG